MSNLFFSDKLLQKTEEIRKFSLTIVEAPAGYGKTTVVNKALEAVKSDTLHWYTATESVPDGSFEWFIRQLEAPDGYSSARLRELGFLNRSNADAAAEILFNAKIEEPLYIVIDNFQYILQNWQPQILSALAQRKQDGLHVILVSQNFGRLRTTLSALNQSICSVDYKDLMLSKDDIGAFARQLDIKIAAEQIDTIYTKTDGWAVAVSLYLQNLQKQSDTVFLANHINELLCDLFWVWLTDKEQEILLRLCLFDRLRDTIIKKLLPEEQYSSALIASLLIRVPLVRYDKIKKEYYPHEILREFLYSQLITTDTQFYCEVYRTSGIVYKKLGQIKDAVACFYHAKDYEAILSCELVGMLAETFDNTSYSEIARTVIKECSEEIRSHYPLSILRLCYALYADADFDGFNAAMQQLFTMVKKSGDNQLMGEYFLVSALSDFPDIDKMKEKYLRAEKFLTGPSQIFTYKEPFLFGSTSMWYLFYTKPGEMMKIADKLADMLDIYNRLTNRHAAGAAELYRGEALSVQGRFEESEIQAYQAAFLAEQAQNVSVSYGVSLLLGINAIYQADMIALQKAIAYLENKAQAYPFMQGKALNTLMVETVRGYLLGLMMETGRSALWTQGEADTLTDLNFTSFMIKTCRITDLILKKEYRRAIASVEASLKMDERMISLPTKNFMYTGLALCYMAIGRFLKASEYLDMALSIAGQDKNYTFLACFQKYFKVLFMMPQIAAKHSKVILEIKQLDIHYTRADESRIFAALENEPEYKSKLTEREHEIAMLAASGMRNAEIAAKLNITNNTVKTHLKTIFQKMNVDRRSLLIEQLK